ncbi:fatty acid desaturase [Bacillus cereus]|nr:fatty acid desaturase [Bacillus cereus]
MKEQVLQVTKGDFVGSASGAVVLTALIVFLSSVLVIIEVLNQTKKEGE